MGLFLEFLLIAFIACQIQLTNGTAPPEFTEEEKTTLSEAWNGPPFDDTKFVNASREKTYLTGRPNLSATAAAKPMAELNWRALDVPEITGTQLGEIYKYIRETKFLIADDGVRRRISWLYPEEGCVFRAELATRAIFQNHMKLPKKIFVLGNHLQAVVENTLFPTEHGKIWDFHVALIYRVGDVAYVLDPSLDDKQPLPLKQWNDKFRVHDGDLKYSICSPAAVGGLGNCYQGDVWPHYEVLYYQLPLLAKEWQHLVDLRKYPERELATCAPYV